MKLSAALLGLLASLTLASPLGPQSEPPVPIVVSWIISSPRSLANLSKSISC